MTGALITVDLPDTEVKFTTPTKSARWECFFEDGVCVRVETASEYFYKSDAEYIYEQLAVSPDHSGVELDGAVLTATWLTAPFLGASYYETAVDLRVMGYEPELS